MDHVRKELNKRPRHGCKSLRKSGHCYVLRDNALKIVDEAAKAQSQLAHSISSFHCEYSETVRGLIENSLASQENVWPGPNNPHFLQQLSEQIAKQIIETTTNNAIRYADIFNTISVNMLDLARENLKIYGRERVDAATGYMSLILKTWSYYRPAFAQQ